MGEDVVEDTGITPNRIRKTRFNLGYSLAEMGAVLGYSKSYICNLEHGSYPINQKFLKRWHTIVKTLNVKPSQPLHTEEGILVLANPRTCSCGCGRSFIPVVWNQTRIPTHPRRRHK